MTSKPFVQIDNLHKDFTMGETQVKALDGVTIDIAAGSFTVVMGPSGSGKSTFRYHPCGQPGNRKNG
jgi:putative ABC transport system ATP-binding protein